MAVSTLCLAVALGSAMPTGDLPGPAEEFGVIDVVSYLSITLFVVGFGVGPLIFAPCEPILRSCAPEADRPQCRSSLDGNPSTLSRFSSTSSSRFRPLSPLTSRPCSLAAW